MGIKMWKTSYTKPLRLLNRIILASTHEEDTILNPFVGSCTTGIAANLLNRRFIGIDKDMDYCHMISEEKNENVWWYDGERIVF